jgi:CheY-like chemotaxis protein
VRVLRLHVDAHHAVDLHPAVSVVHGLDDDRAGALRRGIATITAGLAPDADGLVEVHGLLFDATQDDLDLLDLAADPVGAVVTHAGLRAGALGEGPGEDGLDALARLRQAEREALGAATERRSAARALAESRRAPDPTAQDLARAEQLRVSVALHERTDVEPLRRALDAERDARRAGAGEPASAAVGAITEELAGLGIDLSRRRIDDDEVRRIGHDLLDEHLRHAAWVVGARVELDGLERRLVAALVDPSDDARGPRGVRARPESGERRLERASAELAAAIAGADDARRDAAHLPPLAPEDLEWALLRHLGDRSRTHPAGTAPVVLDHVLDPLADDDVGRLLGRIEPLARGVQVVVVDDHPAAIRWASAAGRGRAAAVHAAPARRSGRSPTMRAAPRRTPG